MKIIVSHYGMLDGGDANGFTRNINLFSELLNFDYDITFITTQKNGFKFPFHKEYRSGVKIVAFPEVFPARFRKGGIAPLSTILKLIYVILTKADIVYSDAGHRPNSGLPCVIHRFFYNSTYISDWWEHYSKGGIYDDLPWINQITMGSFDNFNEVRNRKSADGCIAISQTLKKRALENKIEDSRILLLNTGADITKIPFHHINSQKNKFNIEETTFVVSIIGINQNEITNNIHLFKAIRFLNDSGNKVILLTTGNLDHQIIKKSIISDSWIHFEWIPYKEFSKVISCADVFSLIQINNLRNNSRFPNKFGDYISAGRPIITNAVGDLKNYSDNHPDFFYVIDENYDEVLSALQKAYYDWKNNKIYYKSIRELAENNSWTKRAEKLDEFIKKICVN